MTTINTGSYHAPVAFRGEISLPPAPPREHVDPATTVLLQHASGMSISDLPAPRQALFNSAVQIRLDQITNGYLPNVRKVLGECDAVQSDRMMRLREREAEAQLKAWENGYEVTKKNDKASELQRNGKFVQAGGQAAGGIIDAGSGVKGLRDKARSTFDGSRAKGHERAADHEKIQRDSDRRDAMQLEKRKQALEEGRAPADDRELADVSDELARKYESINSHTKVIRKEKQAGIDARNAEDFKSRSDITLAVSRGMSACLNGAGGAAAAQIDHEGDLEKSEAQRLQLLVDQEKSAASRAGEGASEAQSARAKYLEISAEVTHLERPNYS